MRKTHEPGVKCETRMGKKRKRKEQAGVSAGSGQMVEERTPFQSTTALRFTRAHSIQRKSWELKRSFLT